MYDNNLGQVVKERLLVIAYKRAVINKDTALLFLLRNNYITIGSEDVYVDRHIIKFTYILSITDQELFDLIRYKLMVVSCLNVNIGTMYE